jgi:hypothetical protein
MTTTTKLSARAARALEILKAGGKFRYGLTTGWQGREQFQWSLKGKNGIACKGYGHATYHELVAAGVEFSREASGFTGSAAYYSLKGEAA